LIGSHGILSCITHRPLSTHQISLKSEKLLRTDERTYVCTYLLLLGRCRGVDLKTHFIGLFNVKPAQQLMIIQEIVRSLINVRQHLFITIFYKPLYLLTLKYVLLKCLYHLPCYFWPVSRFNALHYIIHAYIPLVSFIHLEVQPTTLQHTAMFWQLSCALFRGLLVLQL